MEGEENDLHLNDESVEDEGDSQDEGEVARISLDFREALEIQQSEENMNKMDEEEENTEEEGGDGDEEAEEEKEFKELREQVDQLGISQKGHNCGPFFDMLDDDIIVYIFSYLELHDLHSIFLVCVKFSALVKDDYIWQSIYEMREWTKPYSLSLTSNWYHLYLDRLSNELFLIMKEKEKEKEKEEEKVVMKLFGRLGTKLIPQKQSTTVTEIEEDYSHLPPIEQIMKKKNFQIYEMLECSDFATELRYNRNVIQFFQETSTIKKLVDFILREDDCADLDRHKRRGLIHIAFQTLASDFLSDIIIENVELLDYLFEFLNYKQKNVPTSASGYFAKITQSLFEKFPSQSVSYFRGQERIIDCLVENVNDNFLMEMLFKFTDCGLTHQWLHDAQLLPKLTLLLDHSLPSDVQENATQVLVNVFTLCQPWLQSELVLDIFNNPIISSTIIKYIKSENASGIRIKQGLSVLISILNLITEDLVDVPLLIKTIMENIVFFSDILQNPQRIGPIQSLQLTTGELEVPFGSVRLGILELFVALLYTGYPLVVEVMAKEGTFSILLDVFFQYKWNNIIHHQIVQIICGLLCANDDEILKDVLEKCKLIDRIVEVFAKENSSTVGYLGHLKEIANEIIKVTKYSTPIAEMLESNDGWVDFITGRLRDINKLEANDTPNNQEEYDGYSSDDYAYNQYDEEYGEEEEEEDYGDYDEEEEEYEMADEDDIGDELEEGDEQ